MISERLLALATCPRCLLAGTPPPPLRVAADRLCCPACGSGYARTEEWLDLRPSVSVDGRETRYTAEIETFAATLDYHAVGEPLLGAAVRLRWLRRWLPLRPGDLALDLGAGDGRFALWNRDRGATIIALDAAPLFATAARDTLNLVLGDVRVVPFPSAAFDAVYSIDVMEHLDAPGLERFFAEAARVLKPGGRFYLYSNTRERSTLWPVIALWGRLSGLLRRRGVGDFALDDLRKGDHVKVLATWRQVAVFAEYHGLHIKQVRFWNGVFQGLIDNVLIRLGEGALMQRKRRQSKTATASEMSARQAISRRPAARVALLALTGLMQLDIILFGRLRSGPFFALLHKDAAEDAGPQ